MSDLNAGFLQTPPTLGNQYRDDALLREYLARALPQDLRGAIEPELNELGALAGGSLYQAQLADRDHEPELISWDAWGRRVDRVEVSPLWREAQVLSVRHGAVAAGYERRFGPWARVVQFAINHLLQPSLDVYSCPLAMTDGAARTLLDMKNEALIARALPRLTSRDPTTAWTSGQWMTERTGGSDVSLTETVAKKTPEGWRLYGTKWFTSATTAEMALTLARPEGNPAGSRGLALFYLEAKNDRGESNGIRIHRLKDKLGTRKVPTAELSLEGTIAVPVQGLDDGVRKITSMLNITRLWNTMASAWLMRRAFALAMDYATKRVAFGAKLIDKPLHVDTLAGLAAELEGAFLMAFRLAELVGRLETGEGGEELVRVLTPICKLTTGKQGAAVCSEAIETFGGAGYVEDTGLPRLFADAQVLPIWEGTTNVLSLDTLRALAHAGVPQAFAKEIEVQLATVEQGELRFAVDAVRGALEHAHAWHRQVEGDRGRVEAGARHFAMTLGRSYQAALAANHASWALKAGHGPRALAATRRLVAHGLDRIQALDPAEAARAVGR
ncbi:MAG: acyl-CoA dehydrogenase family protein [Deltaproteobacteria bacterium]|nr:acyl-CoA dehydrogenase family protein [Deltaproteobacteria bacterium]